MEQEILLYLEQQYKPHTIILYGSYENQSNNENSDFDVLVITDQAATQHDSSVVQGVILDAFIYSEADFLDMTDMSCFIQTFHGRIVKDEKGFGSRLIEKVNNYIKEHTVVSSKEKEHLVSWCHKMLLRTQRGDTEGMYRWHWLLYDSLEIYCQMRDLFYFGPKKTLNWLEEKDKEGYQLVQQALKKNEYIVLEKWIKYVLESA